MTNAVDPVLLRGSLPEQVRELLLQRISGGAYVPGQRLVETQIAAELHISQGPVREALRQLEVMGLLESFPYRGSVVRRIEHREIDEVSVVRAALEETAASLAAGRGVDVKRLQVQIDGMREAAAHQDRHRWVGFAARFHRLIVQASGNQVLIKTWDSLGIEGRTAQLALSPRVDITAQADAHQAIADALRAADGVRAAALSRAHEEAFVQAFPPEDTAGSPERT